MPRTAQQTVTEVVFHFNVNDPVVYAARLLRKIHRLGQAVTLWCKPDELDPISQWLWVHDQLAFVPHARLGDPVPVVSCSPVFLTDQYPAERDGTVVSLRAELAPKVQRFSKFIEIVGQGDSVKAEARTKWRHYQSLGIQPIGFDTLAPKQ